jgi:hypothetical protein
MFTQMVAVYGWLLRAYPPAFREAYGAEMLRTFRDSARDAWQVRGLIGLNAFWLRTLADLPGTAVHERIAVSMGEDGTRRMASMTVYVAIGAFVGLSTVVYVGLNQMLVGNLEWLRGWMALALSLAVALVLAAWVSAVLGRDGGPILIRTVAFTSWVTMLAGFQGLGLGRFDSAAFTLVVLLFCCMAVRAHARYPYPKGSNWPTPYGDGRALCALQTITAVLLLAVLWSHLTAGAVVFVLLVGAASALGFCTPDIVPPTFATER